MKRLAIRAKEIVVAIEGVRRRVLVSENQLRAAGETRAIQLHIFGDGERL